MFCESRNNNSSYSHNIGQLKDDDNALPVVGISVTAIFQSTLTQHLESTYKSLVIYKIHFHSNRSALTENSDAESAQ